MTTSASYRINSPNVIGETMEGETIVLNYQTGDYYSLNDSASTVWQLIEKNSSFRGMIDRLGVQFEAEATEIESAISSFLQELKNENLIVADSNPKETTSLENTNLETEKQEFQKPAIQKFTDMQDLLLLDPIHEVEEEGWPYAKSDDAGEEKNAG